jgi:hypothetical protein
MTYEGMQVEERIARIGSDDPGSHLGIPISHISARITIKYRVDTVLGAGGRGGGLGSIINYIIYYIIEYN